MEQCCHGIFHDDVIGGVYGNVPPVRLAVWLPWLESRAVGDARNSVEGNDLDQDVQLLVLAAAHATQVPGELLPGQKLPDLLVLCQGEQQQQCVLCGGVTRHRESVWY